MNQFLFGVIGFLMLAIVGVGVTAVLQQPQTVRPAVVQDSTVQTTPSPVTPVTPVTPTAETFTLAQVAQHSSATSCYTAVSGFVYDVTAFINQHPGGAQALLSLCGVDGTAAFDAQHGGQSRPAQELASFKIGILVQ